MTSVAEKQTIVNGSDRDEDLTHWIPLDEIESGRMKAMCGFDGRGRTVKNYITRPDCVVCDYLLSEARRLLGLEFDKPSLLD